MNHVAFGDCRESMKKWIADGVKVQMCVTSPPYFGLRDYGTAKWDGGSPDCDHAEYLGGHGEKSTKQVTSAGTQKYSYKGNCKKCGAKRIDEQLGLEPTPEEYIANMVETFRLVRELMADDGTLWLNIGDSYAGSGKGPTGHNGIGDQENRQGFHSPKVSIPEGIKPKDLIGIPWMLAFALRADGWYLRQDIIWAKPNPMPESVRDRCTKSHEYIFLLSKSPKYFFDSEALNRDETRLNNTPGRAKMGGLKENNYDFRNRRSVWTVTTKPYKGAHFATFPKDLIEPCILAGTSEKGHCSQCGQRVKRVVERTFIPQEDVSLEKGIRGHEGTKPMDDSNSWQDFPRGTTKSETLGWEPSCECEATIVPDIVLDPFIGSGTTAEVALEHGRQYLGCELNPAYETLINERIGKSEFD